MPEHPGAQLGAGGSRGGAHHRRGCGAVPVRDNVTPVAADIASCGGPRQEVQPSTPAVRDRSSLGRPGRIRNPTDAPFSPHDPARGPRHHVPIRRHTDRGAGRRDDRRRLVGRRHRRFPPHRERRTAWAALRHGRLLRLRRDGGWPYRPARLHDQGGRRHGGHRRRGCRRHRSVANRTARRPRTAPATCWWWAPVRRGCRRRSRRPRPAPRSSCWTNAAHRRAIRQAAGRQPRGRGTRRAVPPRHRLRERALAAGARIETEATVWGGFAADEIAALVGGRAVTFRPRRLVLAPGAHERPVPLPGWTLPA